MKAPKLFDVTLTMHSGMVVYPGNAPVQIEAVKSIDRGGSSNVSLLHIGSHTSTHVDAPRHYLADGVGVDAIAPELMVGRARLFQLGEVPYIDDRLVGGLDLEGIERVLFGTGNSRLLQHDHVHTDYAYLTGPAASNLLERGVKLVGVDYLSVEEYKKPGRPAHHILLKAGVVIVEGLCLADVPAGDYELLCLPLKLKDADGAPARVILREIE